VSISAQGQKIIPYSRRLVMSNPKKAIPIRSCLFLILIGLAIPFSNDAYSEPEPAVRDSPLIQEWETREVPKQCWALAVDVGEKAIIAGDDLNYRRGMLRKYDDSGKITWAMIADLDSNYWNFMSAAADAQGNAYFAGNFKGRALDFGNGVKLGPSSEVQSGMVLVKYDSGGKAAWAKASFNELPERYSPTDMFVRLAVDAAGNIFALGEKRQYGSNYPFLDKSVRIPNIDPYTGHLVFKLDAMGRPMNAVAISWDGISIGTIATDGANLYLAGFLSWSREGPIDFGNGVRLPPPGPAHCAFLIKYDSSLKALWARTVSGGVYSGTGTDGDTDFMSLEVDNRGNAYVGGYIAGKRRIDFGDGVTAAGTDPRNNPVLVKYDAAGKAMWARTIDASGPEDYVANIRAGSKNVYVSTCGTQIIGIDFTGKLLWQTDIPSVDGILQLAIDKRENVYVTANGGPKDPVTANTCSLVKYRNTDFASKTWATAADSRVRVRSGGNLQAATLGYLEKGDLVEVLERSPERMKVESMEDYWYRISRLSDGLTGWCYGYFIKMKDED
jgi:hypothetical protein